MSQSIGQSDYRSIDTMSGCRSNGSHRESGWPQRLLLTPQKARDEVGERAECRALDEHTGKMFAFAIAAPGTSLLADRMPAGCDKRASAAEGNKAHEMN